MEVIVAKTAGFCFGVNRAVSKVWECIDDKPLYTYGPIIHNRQVVEEFGLHGVKVLNSLEELPIVSKGTIIVRSHGVGQDAIEKMKASGFKVYDATCPYVIRIHKLVSKYSQMGYKVIIVGNKKHPEVIGIEGWSKHGAIIIDSIDELETMSLDKSEKYCLVAQTTYNHLKYTKIVEKLQNDGFHVIINETICSATEERQKEAVEIAKKVTKMIVIGGRHSSNTQKLYEICKEHCDNTYHIETIADLELNVFSDSDIIGITAGASTPKNIIEEVIIKWQKNKVLNKC